MSKSFYIAKRFISDRKNSRFFSFISRITIIGIALGTIALNISLAVLEGFEETVAKKIADFNSHIQVYAYNERAIKNYEDIETKIEKLLEGELLIISPYVQKNCIVKHKNSSEGILIKGVKEKETIKLLQKDLIKGKIFSKNSKNILIGEKLAFKLGVEIGDTILLMTFNSENESNFVIKNFFSSLRIAQFIVSGIFRSGMDEYDNLYAFASLGDVQKFLAIDDGISGFDIKIINPEKAEDLAYKLTSNLGYPNFARSIYETYAHIFNWIDLQRKPIPIMLSLISLVAAINIIGTLLMLSLEKSKQLGVLMTLGASQSLVRKIFVWQGVYLSILGTISGTALSFILCFIQIEFKIIKLPGSVYYLSEAPIAINLFNFAVTAFCAIGLSLIFSLIPAHIASRKKPAAIIRFD